MSKSQNQSTQNAWGDRIRALKNVPPVLNILWESGPQVVTWGLILRVFVALMPWAIAKVAAWIINGVNQVLQHRGLPPHFWWVVGLEVGLAVLTGLLWRTVTRIM
jgi:ATP-binding cassette subfamily B protein